MIVLRALAGLHDLVELAGWLRQGRFQFADLAADWLTDGAFTRHRDRAALLEARLAAEPPADGWWRQTWTFTPEDFRSWLDRVADGAPVAQVMTEVELAEVGEGLDA